VCGRGSRCLLISGPHKLRGVEIYKGKPIFYSLGNFFMQNETIEPMPDDMYESYGLGDTALAADFYDARAKLDPKTGLPTSYYPAQADIWRVPWWCRSSGDTKSSRSSFTL